MMQDHIFFTGVNILMAWSVYVALMSGTLTFASGAFMAVGAYGAGVMTTKFAWPLLLAVWPVALAAGLLAMAVSIPVLRTRGIYLILVTMGMAVCVRTLLEAMPALGGVSGLGGLYDAEPWHIVVLVLLIGSLLFVLQHLPLQRTLDAVREDERIAASCGINPKAVKVAAFGASAFIAALAGAFYAHYVNFIRPANFDINASIFPVLFVILGGVRNMWGPLLGAVLMTLLPEFLRPVAEWRNTIFCAAIVVMLLFRPEGLLLFRVVSIRGKARGEP